MNFPRTIPWDGGEITVEHDDGGLVVDFVGFELDGRALTLASAVAYHWATRHIASDRTCPGVNFAVGPDVVCCEGLTADEAEQCLNDLLAAIRISASLGAVTERAT